MSLFQFILDKTKKQGFTFAELPIVFRYYQFEFTDHVYNSFL